MNNQKHKGVILYYINAALSVVINLFITPVLITSLTDVDYSIYKVMSSFVGPLLMFNLGMATIVARSVARSNEKNDGIEKENTFAIAIIVAAFTSLFVVALGIIMSKLIPVIYAGAYTSAQLELAQKLCGVFVATTAVQIFSDPFKGCAIGNERFVLSYGTKTLQYVLRCILIVVMLSFGYGALALALIDFAIVVIIAIINILYAFYVLNERPRLHRIDKKELVSMLMFSLAVLLQVVINNINGNIDLVILGAKVSDKAIVTMYSCALTIYYFYSDLVYGVSSVFLPKAAKLSVRSCSGEELTDFIIKPGRFQSVISTGLIFGFVLLGKDFICLWIGDKYIDAYYVIIVLMVAASIHLVQTACELILDANLKRLYRSVVLALMAVFNFIISLILVNYLGFWGVVIGTVFSLIFGNAIIMNIYYKRVFRINVIRMFKEIFRTSIPAGIIAFTCTRLFACLVPEIFLGFVIKGIIFVALYSVLLWKFGFNEEEKLLLKKLLHIK